MNELFLFIIQCLYFMLPAYTANMAPIALQRRFRWLARPLDFGKRLGKRRIFGAHKTFRGLIFAVIFGIATTYLQSVLNVSELNIINYKNDWLLFGFLMGFGAIFGDLVKSFFKRRFSIASGERFIPFDQLDFVIGALVFASAFVPSFALVIALLIISPALHILVNHIAFWKGIRKSAW